MCIGFKFASDKIFLLFPFRIWVLVTYPLSFISFLNWLPVPGLVLVVQLGKECEQF